MSRSTDEHIADAMAAIKDESRRWSAMAQAQRAASRATVKRICLLTTALSAVLVLCSAAVCVMAARLALSGTLIAVPVFVAVVGMSVSLSLYVVGAAVAYRSVATDRVLRAGMRFAVVVTKTGQTLFMGTALATVLAGVLVAFNGLPMAAVMAAVVAVVVAVLGRKLGGFVQQSATA